jgi:hypothetical protein
MNSPHLRKVRRPAVVLVRVVPELYLHHDGQLLGTRKQHNGVGAQLNWHARGLICWYKVSLRPVRHRHAKSAQYHRN